MGLCVSIDFLSCVHRVLVHAYVLFSVRNRNLHIAITVLHIFIWYVGISTPNGGVQCGLQILASSSDPVALKYCGDQLRR